MKRELTVTVELTLFIEVGADDDRDNEAIAQEAATDLVTDGYPGALIDRVQVI
jgi:hypothetical protein